MVGWLVDWLVIGGRFTGDVHALNGQVGMFVLANMRTYGGKGRAATVSPPSSAFLAGLGAGGIPSTPENAVLLGRRRGLHTQSPKSRCACLGNESYLCLCILQCFD